MTVGDAVMKLGSQISVGIMGAKTCRGLMA